MLQPNAPSTLPVVTLQVADFDSEKWLSRMMRRDDDYEIRVKDSSRECRRRDDDYEIRVKDSSRECRTRVGRVHVILLASVATIFEGDDGQVKAETWHR